MSLKTLKKAIIAYVDFIKAVWSDIAYPLIITGGRNTNLEGYRIYGNSVQEGTPTPETPVEVQSVGELVTEGDYAGKYKISVQARGKNLFDSKIWGNLFEETEEGIFKSTTFINLTNNKRDFCLEPGTYSMSYMHKSPIGTNYRLAFDFEDGTSTNFYVASTGDWIEQKNIVVSLKKRVVKIYWTYTSQSSEVFFKDIQIESGDITTYYESYIKPKTVDIYLDEPLRKIGDYSDYIDFENQKVIRNIKKNIFDGSEAWSNYSISTFRLGITNNQGNPDAVRCIINLFTGRKWDDLWKNTGKQYEEGDYIIGVARSNSGLMITPSQTNLTLDEWKEQLVLWHEFGTPLIVWYDIPVQEETIEIPDVPQFKGTTIYEVQTKVNPSGIEACYYE